MYATSIRKDFEVSEEERIWNDIIGSGEIRYSTNQQRKEAYQNISRIYHGDARFANDDKQKTLLRCTQCGQATG